MLLWVGGGKLCAYVCAWLCVCEGVCVGLGMASVRSCGRVGVCWVCGCARCLVSHVGLCVLLVVGVSVCVCVCWWERGAEGRWGPGGRVTGFGRQDQHARTHTLMGQVEGTLDSDDESDDSDDDDEGDPHELRYPFFVHPMHMSPHLSLRQHLIPLSAWVHVPSHVYV